MSKIYHFKSFFSFYLRAKTIYKVHSPFVFSLFRDALQLDKPYHIQAFIERHRKSFLDNKSIISFLELGAGDKSNTSRSIASIAKSSLSPDWQCRLLFNLVEYLKPKTAIELGTSLGISTAYLAGASKELSLHTFEGNPSSAALAKDMFDSLGLKNIQIHEGNFDVSLEDYLSDQSPTLDLAFLDGNHQYEPSIRYFETLLPYCHRDSVLVFDDIYWSSEMTKAWEELKARSEVTLSIDLYCMGLLFFKSELKEKQHFSLIPSKLKPWQKYLP